ncbi:MAG TPA: hypothetical protein VJ952_10930, partial [Opitutales bacterium]|nr:hypothetical protein [Opitutales bacterium]
MKPQTFLLGLFVWLASVGAAYYLGLNLNSPEPADSAQVGAFETTAPTVEKKAETEEAEASAKSIGSILEISREDLDAALRQADELDDTDKRALLAEAFALPAGDYRRARMIRSLLGRLAETSPIDALALADEIGSLRETEQARVAILEVWAEKDPVAALAWANLELANEPLRTQSSQLIAIYRGYAVNNPKAAFSSALAMTTANRSEERIRNYALEEIIEQQIANGGLLDAKLQVELLEDGPVKDNLFSELVDEWASFDPEGAAAYVDSLGDDVSGSVKVRLLGE